MSFTWVPGSKHADSISGLATSPGCVLSCHALTTDSSPLTTCLHAQQWLSVTANNLCTMKSFSAIAFPLQWAVGDQFGLPATGHNGYHNSVQVARMQSWSYILLIVLHWKTFLFPLSHDHTPSQPDPNESLKVSVTFLVCLFVPYLPFTAYKILWSLPFPHLYTLYTPLVLRASLGLMVVLFVFCLKLTACLKSINTQDITL